ncbi:TadE/TadG family type IV pilus assembly protein, partial [Streptomyces sp. NPDC001215]
MILHRMLRARGDDRGGVTVFVAVCVIALIGIIGLAIDGGSKMRATERADYIAGEAARAGGQAIDPADAISGRAITVDPHGLGSDQLHQLAGGRSRRPPERERLRSRADPR